MGSEAEKDQIEVASDRGSAIIPGCARPAQQTALDAVDATETPSANDDALDHKLFDHISRAQRGRNLLIEVLELFWALIEGDDAPHGEAVPEHVRARDCPSPCRAGASARLRAWPDY